MYQEMCRGQFSPTLLHTQTMQVVVGQILSPPWGLFLVTKGTPNEIKKKKKKNHSSLLPRLAGLKGSPRTAKPMPLVLSTDPFPISFSQATLNSEATNHTERYPAAISRVNRMQFSEKHSLFCVLFTINIQIKHSVKQKSSHYLVLNFIYLFLLLNSIT